jgi:hypothetical protein
MPYDSHSPYTSVYPYGGYGNPYNPNPVTNPPSQTNIPPAAANPYSQNSTTIPYDPNNPYPPNNITYPYGSYGNLYDPNSINTPYDPNFASPPYAPYGDPYFPNSFNAPYGTGNPYDPNGNQINPGP